MKHNPIEMLPNRLPREIMRRVSRFGLTAAQVVLLGLGAAIASGQADDSAADDQGAQVLTRGPVHEAFAEMVSYNPEPGVIVEKAPPEAIEELPPEERPEGDNITWIPGYWGWDDERSDYLWISGTWRALPPGRQWTVGYWRSTGQGYQWISGYWADSSAQETTYLPKPPVTVEAGPNVEAPSRDYSWTPGCWIWQQERYAWRPGYWVLGRSDWVWVPARYVWTPRGYVFVDGYWDYNFDRRGVLYAPVYFQSGYYSRPGYSYSPVIAIGLVALMEHIFLRPHYHHYYFGDYYDRRYRDRGYYWPYAYHSSRYGYDPVYCHRRWKHRDDRDWERRYVESYDYRRDHESARPPRTWSDQKKLKMDSSDVTKNRLMMADPLDQVAKREGSNLRLQPVQKKEKERLADLGREVRKNRDERKTLEAEGASTTSGKTEREIKPTKVKLPKSSIMGKDPAKLSPEQAPPKRQSVPAATETNTRKPERQTDTDKPRPEPKKQQEAREPEARKEQPKPERKETSPRVEKEQPSSRREVEPPAKKTQSEPEQRVEKPKKDTRPEPQPKAREPERKAQPQPRQPSKPAEDARPKQQSNPAGRQSGSDKDDDGQSSGKSKKKERD